LVTEEEPKTQRTWTESVEVAGNQLKQRAKELVAEGNVRRLVIRKPSGDLLIEIPLTAGAVLGGALVIAYPFLMAIAAVGGMMARVRIDVVRVDTTPKE
jgi:hypothetical protein